MGQTIITYLIENNPKGAHTIFMSNKTCKAVVIPRSNLTIVNKRTELESPAFYLLLGEGSSEEPSAYLGETENFVERIKGHHYNKDFWQKVIVFISTAGDMTKSDVQYLEHIGVKTAKKAGQYCLEENKQTPKKPNLPEHQEEDIKQFFEDVKVITSFAGCNIFDEHKSQNEHLFYCVAKDTDAKGTYTEKGFTVLKGSRIRNGTTNSFKNKDQRSLIIGQLTKIVDGKLILQKDKTFNSPSSASSFCIGNNSNGWKDWKDKSGKTLDDVYRKGTLD